MNDVSPSEIFAGGGWVLGLLIFGIAWYNFGRFILWAADKLGKPFS